MARLGANPYTQCIVAQWRPARLNAATLEPAADWIDGYRRFWEHSFDALDRHLTSNPKGATND